MMISTTRFITLLAAVTGSFAAGPDPFQNANSEAKPGLDLDKKRNDWDTRCGNKCAFDLPNTPEAPGKGFMTIEGEDDAAIVDLTSAAGWKIASCDITGDNRPRKGDIHKQFLSKEKPLWIGVSFSCPGGDCAKVNPKTFVDELARLPQECKKIGFAVVTQIRVGTGNIKAELTSDLSKAKKKYRFSLAGEAHDEKSAKQQIQQHPRDLLKRFDESWSDTVHAEYREETVLFDGGLICGQDAKAGVSVTGKVSVTPDVDITATFGIVLRGGFGFPELIHFEHAEIFTLLKGHAGGKIELDMKVMGQLDSKEISVYKVPITPLTFFGLLTFGPSFELLVRANASLSIEGKLAYNLRYDFDEKFSLPSSGKPFSPKLVNESPPTASGIVDVGLSVHLIPRLNFGLYALGVVAASVFVDADASLSADIMFGAKKALSDIGAEEKLKLAAKAKKDAAQRPSDNTANPTLSDDEYYRQASAKFGKNKYAKVPSRIESKLDAATSKYRRGENEAQAQAQTPAGGLTPDEVVQIRHAEVETKFGAAARLRGILDLRVGVQVHGGRLTTSLLNLMGINLDKQQAFRFYTLVLFDKTIPLGGDQSVFQTRNVLMLPEAPSRAVIMLPRADEKMTPIVLEAPREKSFLPIDLGKVGGLECKLDFTENLPVSKWTTPITLGKNTEKIKKVLQHPGPLIDAGSASEFAEAAKKISW